MPIGPTMDQVWAVDPVLTNLVNSRANADEDFVADAAFPPVYNEGIDRGTIYLLHTGMVGAGNREIDRGEGSTYTEVGFQPSTTSFACREYGAVAAVGRHSQAISQVGMDLMEIAAMVVGHEVLIQRELRAVATFFGNADWGANEQTLGAAAQWDDAGGAPLANFWTAKRSVKLNGRANANACMMGFDSLRVAVGNGDITSLMPSASRQGQITMSDLVSRLAEAFEIENLYVGRAVRNTASLNQTEVYGFILTDNMLLWRQEPAASVNASGGAQFASTDGGQATVTERWFDMETRKDKVRTRETRDELVIDANKGYLTINCAN